MNLVEVKLHGPANIISKESLALALGDLEGKRFLLVPIQEHFGALFMPFFIKTAFSIKPSIYDYHCDALKRNAAISGRKVIEIRIEGGEFLKAKIIFSNIEIEELYPEEAILIAIKGGWKIMVDSTLLLELSEIKDPFQDQVAVAKMEKRRKAIPDEVGFTANSHCGKKLN